MNTTDHDRSATPDPFADWMRSGLQFWEKLLAIQTPGVFPPAGAPFVGAGPVADMQKNMTAGFKAFQLMMSALTDSGGKVSLNSMNLLPEMLMDSLKQGWNDLLTLQNKWFEAISKAGRPSPAYRFEDLNQEFFQAVRSFYENEVQKYLRIPPLGLTRFHQERLNRFMDQHHLFQSTLSEFMYLFYVPMEKSFKVMRDRFEELADKGEIHDNFKEYYNAWIKTLEGHYMTLLKSPEYTRVMNSTIEALVNFRKAREDFFTDLLADVPVPTYKEMDELYKEVYLYKKKVQELTARLERLEAPAAPLENPS